MADPARRPRAKRVLASPPPEQLLDWVEQVAAFFHDDNGLPPITGRIMGWLMVCDPPEQSGAAIAEAIRASRASITTNVRLLTTAGLVRRLGRPGERTAYYVIDDEAWERSIRRRADAIAAFVEITGDAVELLDRSGQRAARVRAAHESFKWFSGLLNEALSTLRAKRSNR